MAMNSKVVVAVAAAAMVAGVAIGGFVFAKGGYSHDHSHMGGGGGSHAMHDEVNMPGLRGKNASATESEEIAVLFRAFETLTREVENLPNGIKTVTRSSDPEVMNVLVGHAAGMINRVEAKDDPQIAIQSPTLDIFFQRGDEIETTLEVTEVGLVIVQTSANPDVVAALQTHAAEVTAMADRGMAAVHEMMEKQGRGH